MEPPLVIVGVRTLCIALLLACAPISAARADCAATPVADPDDMVVSFLKINGVQAASASLLTSSVKEGMLVYDATDDALKLCDGTNWQSISMGTASDPRIGTLTANKWCAVNAGGTAIDCTQNAPSGASATANVGYVQIGGAGNTLTDSGTTAGQQLFWDNTNKRLGIGTASPASKLHVVDNGAYALIQSTGTARTDLRLQVAGTTGGNYIWFTDADTAEAGGISYDHNSNSLTLQANSSPRVTISQEGNVGIGTTTPTAAALLELASTTKGFLPPRMTTAQRDAVSSPAPGLMIFNTTAGALEIYNGTSWSSTSNADVSFMAYGSTTSVPNTGAWTDVVNPTQSFDNGGDNYNPATGKFTAPSAGNYLFTATFAATVQATGLGLLIQTDAASAGGTQACYNHPAAPSGQSYTVNCAGIISLAAGQAVEMAAYSLTAITANASRTMFAGFKLGGGDSGGGGSSVAAGSSGQIQFNGTSNAFAADANLAWDNTNKRLGIGTSSPTSIVHVMTPSNASTQGVVVQAPNNSYITLKPDLGAGMINGLTQAGDAGIFFTDNAIDTGGLVIGPWASGSAGLRITNTGNVGIGTSAPAGKLDVAGSLGTASISMDGTALSFSRNGDNYLAALGGTSANLNLSATNLLLLNTGGSERVRITGDGLVGIGTAAPTFRLDVSGNAMVGRNEDLTPGDTGTVGQLLIDGNGYGGWVALDATAMRVGHNSSVRGLALQTNETDRLFIDGSGNVGIGTTSPTEALEVNGNVKMGYEIKTATGTTSFNVGCTAGKQVIGGGCSCTGSTYVRSSIPSGTTAWHCACDAGTGNTAYAICANIK